MIVMFLGSILPLELPLEVVIPFLAIARRSLLSLRLRSIVKISLSNTYSSLLASSLLAIVLIGSLPLINWTSLVLKTL